MISIISEVTLFTHHIGFYIINSASVCPASQGKDMNTCVASSILIIER